MAGEHTVNSLSVLRDKCRDLYQWVTQLPCDQRTQALIMLEQLLNSVMALYTGHRLKVVKFCIESSQAEVYELSSLAQVLLLAGCVQPATPLDSIREETLLATESPQQQIATESPQQPIPTIRLPIACVESPQQPMPTDTLQQPMVTESAGQPMPAFDYGMADYCGSVLPGNTSVCPDSDRPEDAGCLSSVEDDSSRLDTTCARLDALVDLASKLAGADRQVMEPCTSVQPTISLTVPVHHGHPQTWPHLDVVSSLHQVVLGQPEPDNPPVEEEPDLPCDENPTLMGEDGESKDVLTAMPDHHREQDMRDGQNESADEVWKPNTAEELAEEEESEEEQKLQRKTRSGRLHKITKKKKVPTATLR